MGGDCNMPLGVLAQIHNDRIQLQAYLGDADGQTFIEVEEEGPIDDAIQVADQIVELFWERGAKAIIENCKQNPPKA